MLPFQTSLGTALMSSRVFDYDRSTYVLESLKLDVEGLENPSLTESPRIGSFKVLGKGGFGSIFVGTISKCTVPLFNTNFKFQLLGLYHGVLLAQPRKHTLVVEKENVTPITVAVKRIDGEPDICLISQEKQVTSKYCGATETLSLFMEQRKVMTWVVCVL